MRRFFDLSLSNPRAHQGKQVTVKRARIKHLGMYTARGAWKSPLAALFPREMHALLGSASQILWSTKAALFTLTFLVNVRIHARLRGMGSSTCPLTMSVTHV